MLIKNNRWFILGVLAVFSAACSSDDPAPSGGDAGQAGAAGFAASGGSGGMAVGGTGGSGGTSIGGSGGTGGAYVECTTTCVPEPPKGWRLGYLVSESLANSPQGCGDGFDLPVVVHQSVEANDRSCACQCSAPAGGECDGGSAKIWTGGSCDGDSIDLAANACKQEGAGLPSGGIRPQAIDGTPSSIKESGTCKPSAIPDDTKPSWSDSFTACRANVLPAIGQKCGDDHSALCAPRFTASGENPKLCLFAVGEQAACPSGYANRTVLYGGYDDQRTCGDKCQCQPAMDQSCLGAVKVFRQQGCRDMDVITEASLKPSSHSACVTLQYPSYERVFSAIFDPGEPEGGKCKPKTPTVPMVGSVKLSQPVTACCR